MRTRYVGAFFEGMGLSISQSPKTQLGIPATTRCWSGSRFGADVTDDLVPTTHALHDTIRIGGLERFNGVVRALISKTSGRRSSAVPAVMAEQSAA